jgi:hypothetical protein
VFHGFQGFHDVLVNLTWQGVVTALIAAFVFGQVIAWVYEFTYKGLSYSRNFTQTIVLTSLCATIVVLAMSNSLVAGLGLIGVLAMVRFRTNLKSSRDLVFIMGGATVGIACGVSAFVAAAAGTIAFALVALYMHLGSFGSRERFDGVIRFRLPASADVDVASVLAAHCRTHVMLSLGDVAAGTQVEHAYQVKFRRDEDRERLVAALHRECSAADIVLLLQETGIEY